LKPNFFIVGAAKSGTTSLASSLSQHPEVYFSPVKEPFYFVSDYGLTDFDEYISLFKKAGQARAVGEASTGYLSDSQAPKAIYNRFPDARIIIILRDPVDMAYSLWAFMRVQGTEDLPFEEAIKQQEFRKTENFKGKCAGWYANYLYLERASYYEQVKRYLETFGSDGVRVYLFEEFIKYPDDVLGDISNFLLLDNNYKLTLEKNNEGGEIRFRFLKKLKNRKYPFLKNIFPVAIRNRVRSLVRKINVKTGQKLKIDPLLKDRLKIYFEDDINKLEKLLMMDLSCWRIK
jgi:hypothetical protein